MNKFRGTLILSVFIILSVTLTVFFGIKFIKSQDVITSYALVILFSAFLLGLFFAVLQQTILDKEIDGSNSKTLERAIFNTMKEHSRSDYISLVDKYSAVYENSIKEYFSIISSISSILITMGLIGTVFGLTVTMSGLKNLVSSSGDQTAILTEMTTILSGVDTSFYTTLFGAFFGGIVLRICLIVNNRYAQSAANNVKLMWMMPASLPATNTQSLTGESDVKSVLVLEEQYLRLSQQMQSTTEVLLAFKTELAEMAKISLHSKLAIIADGIGTNTEQIKRLITSFKES